MGFFDFFKAKEKKKSIVYGDVVIEYDTLPPGFEQVTGPLRFATCGSCKFRGNGKNGMICTKYGVEYYGPGCARASICSDYKNGIVGDDDSE